MQSIVMPNGLIRIRNEVIFLVLIFFSFAFHLQRNAVKEKCIWEQFVSGELTK